MRRIERVHSLNSHLKKCAKNKNDNSLNKLNTEDIYNMYGLNLIIDYGSSPLNPPENFSSDNINDLFADTGPITHITSNKSNITSAYNLLLFSKYLETSESEKCEIYEKLENVIADTPEILSFSDFSSILKLQQK